MILENVRVKPDTRNHKGFFVLEAAYKLVNIDGSGWALICLDDYACHYVDPNFWWRRPSRLILVIIRNRS